MAEFHVGDPVSVLYAGSPKSFIVKAITVDGRGERLYSGDGQGWTPESRLDYDLTPEQKDAWHSLERGIWNLELAAEALPGLVKTVNERGLPPSVFFSLKKRIAEAILTVGRTPVG